VSDPARAPSGEIPGSPGARSSFAVKPPKPAFSAVRKACDGRAPSCRMPLYPAVQALRVSTPVSCQVIQSAASIQRSARP
jgi:hypothetical protein